MDLFWNIIFVGNKKNSVNVKKSYIWFSNPIYIYIIIYIYIYIYIYILLNCGFVSNKLLLNILNSYLVKL
jgi:hypothetical protein